ncbi:hypothetical protein ACFW1A_32825 [Kitasatospora sp. NPDC058965]|uniref:hypothetical protein n=1 Tax=Kitasatospora sp. NPDC058965 TaxID=3346682 RepID=UPI0036916F98
MSVTPRGSWPQLMRVLRWTGWALALAAGVREYLTQQEQREAELRLLAHGVPLRRLTPPVTLAPPGRHHPERLAPELPLSPLELRLRRELAHLDHLLPGPDPRRAQEWS